MTGDIVNQIIEQPLH